MRELLSIIEFVKVEVCPKLWGKPLLTIIPISVIATRLHYSFKSNTYLCIIIIIPIIESITLKISSTAPSLKVFIFKFYI